MWAAVQQNVRYWGLLVLKLVAGESLVAALLWWINFFYRPRTPLLHVNLYQFGYDLGYTTAVGVLFLLAYLVIYFALRDQQYRCRVCLRRMRMPVARGSWPSGWQAWSAWTRRARPPRNAATAARSRR